MHTSQADAALRLPVRKAQAAVVCVVGFAFLGLHAPPGAVPVAVLAIANALLGMALGLLVSAFGYPALGAAAAEGSPIEQVQWGRCRYWARVCSARWGWRTPRWFVCMRRHVC